MLSRRDRNKLWRLQQEQNRLLGLAAHAQTDSERSRYEQAARDLQVRISFQRTYPDSIFLRWGALIAAVAPLALLTRAGDFALGLGVSGLVVLAEIALVSRRRRRRNGEREGDQQEGAH